MARIGFIGLGNMGLPMAQNLIKARHAVTGFDMSKAQVDKLVETGGKAAGSIKEAASGADVVITMLPAGVQVREVYLGNDGVVATASQSTLLIDSSTIDVETARAVSSVAQGKGLAMLDAPVSGGIKGAAAGSLTIMVSGDAAAIERARPVLDAVGQRVFDVGREAGLGSTAKMINQLLCGVHIAAAAEAMHVAERAGVSLATMHEIISVSAGNSWMWGDRGPRMMQDDPPVTSAVDIFVKDLGIVLDQGKAMRQGLPLSSAAMQMFLAASGLGHGKADDSQVIRAYRALNGKTKA
jgi:L-threonate 2-dehydrogenase